MWENRYLLANFSVGDELWRRVWRKGEVYFYDVWLRQEWCVGVERIGVDLEECDQWSVQVGPGGLAQWKWSAGLL